MDKKQFVDMVSNPTQFSSQERGWLHAVQAKYPYSSVINILATLADCAYGYDTPEERCSAMLSMCVPSRLDAMMDSVSQPIEETSFDVLDEINNIQEVSFKTAPKSVILSKFLHVDSDEKSEKDNQTERSFDLNSKKSLQPDISLGTETLAVILENQGKPENALAVYKNLIALNPEKSSIFAIQIERLEKIIKNK